MSGPTIITTPTPTELDKPATDPSWWDAWTIIRRVGVFLLGAAIIVEALVSYADPWPELLIGAVMVGAFPIDSLIAARHDDK